MPAGDVKSAEPPARVITAPLAGAAAPGQILSVGAGGSWTVAASGGTGKFGCMLDPAAVSGATVRILVEGDVNLVAGGPIFLGSLLAVGSNGSAVATTSPEAGAVLGYALEAATNGATFCARFTGA